MTTNSNRRKSHAVIEFATYLRQIGQRAGLLANCEHWSKKWDIEERLQPHLFCLARKPY